MTRFTIKRYSGENEPADENLGLGQEELQDDNHNLDLNKSLIAQKYEDDVDDKAALIDLQPNTISSSSSCIPLMGQIANGCPPENSLSCETSNKSIKFGSSNQINLTSQSQVKPSSINNNLLTNPFKPKYLPSKESSMINHFNQSHLLPLTQVVSDPPTASSGMVTISPFSYSPVAQRGRTFAARHTKRLVFKDGSCNVTSANVTQKKKKYLVDIFTTCVDMRWRYLLALFAGAFIFSWFIFGIAWYAIAISFGDHFLHTIPDNDITLQERPILKNFGLQPNESQILNASNVNLSSQISFTPSERKPCVNNVYDFPTALLFSIETQHTIGYGFRVVEPTCSSGIFLIMVQSCIGIFVQSLMTGLIFAKLSQPKKRAHTIMFSKCAVITKRDGIYCLLFRVGDMRRSHFVATSIRALLVKDRVTKEGECIPLCQYPLDVKTETSAGDAFVFMVWPVVVVHKIDTSSPLWNLSASQLLQEKFEIIVIMEGIVESTGMTTQVRTSYLPGEILWGHCLAPLLTYQKENGQYKIDYAQFHSIVSMPDMPECSAKDYASKRLETGLDEAHIDISHYFTIPSKVNNANRVSVMQRVRGSLKLRRSRKEKSIAPSTAPILQPNLPLPNNVFFEKGEYSNLSPKSDCNTSISIYAKSSNTIPGEELLRSESSNIRSIAAVDEIIPGDWNSKIHERREILSPQIGSTSSDPTSELGRSSTSSSGDSIEIRRGGSFPEQPNADNCFNYSINVPRLVNVAIS